MIPSKFKVDGVGYVVDAYGVIRQDPPIITQQYDAEYIHDRYDSLPDHGSAMSYLRTGFVIGALGSVPGSVLDIGYGNGGFLRVMRDYGTSCFGYDISGYPLPEDCKVLTWEQVIGKCFDVVTLFDSLEHFENPECIFKIDALYYVITVPYCHIRNNGLQWFEGWKHRRPGEHISAYDPVSLVAWMKSHDYEHIQNAPVEDIIRISDYGIPNTFTAVFKR
jgi:hypothetical protein